MEFLKKKWMVLVGVAAVICVFGAVYMLGNEKVPEGVLQEYGEASAELSMEVGALTEAAPSIEEVVWTEIDSSIEEALSTEVESSIEELVAAETEPSVEKLVAAETKPSIEKMPSREAEVSTEARLSTEAEPSTETVPPAEAEQWTESELSDVHVCRLEMEETSAACLTPGKVEEKCTECGKIILKRTIEPLGHDFVKSVWETATCEKGGYYNNVCQRCGLVESTTEEPLRHEVEDVIVQEGNCMEDTIIRHICRNCEQQIESDTRFTPQTHNWISSVIDGKEVSYCEWCGVVQ